jgi:hypothetical protein
MADAERVTPRTLKALRGFTQRLQGLSGLTQTSQAMGLLTGSGTAVAETSGGDADYFFEGSGHVALIEEAASE